jgi:TolB-like protein/DNA-binding winged helix-turn-helix (wHTH) protein
MSAEALDYPPDWRRPVDLAREAAFRLACVDVRPATREVVGRRGQREVLEPRVMQVLVALARRRGEVVSRDELIHACWRGRVVGDDAVNRCVAALRRVGQAFGGLAIETIARVGYRLDVIAAPRPDPASGAPALAGVRARPLLAVLPFEALSDEAGMGHLCDGISDEILQAVAQRTALQVVARAASFQFRGAGKVVRQMADELSATHVLDGSVRRSGLRVRVSAYLIECDGQTTLWSQRFDRELHDVFALQDAVAEAVAAGLRKALGSDA